MEIASSSDKQQQPQSAMAELAQSAQQARTNNNDDDDENENENDPQPSFRRAESEVGQEMTTVKDGLMKVSSSSASSASLHYGTSSPIDPHAPNTITIDEAIERLGYGYFQNRILIAAGLCFAADSMEVLLLSFLAIVLQAQWSLSEHETDMITSSVFLGAMLGTLVLGPLGDRIGRKPVFSITAGIIALFGFATAAVNNVQWLILVRFLVGFGVGGLTVPFDTLAEFVPTSHRGQNLMVIEYFWVFGTLMVPVLAYITLGEGAITIGGDTGENAWRLFVILCAIPCIVSTAIGIVVVPESPRWLISKGRPEKALGVLRRAAVVNGKDPMALFPERLTIEDDEVHEESSTNFRALFTPHWYKLTLKLWGIWAGFALLYYGTIIIVTQVFAETDMKDENGDGDLYSFDYAAIFASASAEIAGTTIILFTIDRYGRVPSQSISFFGGGVSVLALCYLANAANPNRNIMIAAAFSARMFMMGATCVAWISTAELLTTEIRTTGHSAANAIARISGAASPYIVSKTTPLPVIGWIMITVSMFTAYLSWLLPETKGKSMGVGHHKGDADFIDGTVSPRGGDDDRVVGKTEYVMA